MSLGKPNQKLEKQGGAIKYRRFWHDEVSSRDFDPFMQMQYADFSQTSNRVLHWSPRTTRSVATADWAACQCARRQKPSLLSIITCGICDTYIVYLHLFLLNVALLFVSDLWGETFLFSPAELWCSASRSWAINPHAEVMLLKENSLYRHFLGFNEGGGSLFYMMNTDKKNAILFIMLQLLQAQAKMHSQIRTTAATAAAVSSSDLFSYLGLKCELCISWAVTNTQWETLQLGGRYINCKGNAFSFFSFFLCASNSVGSLLHRLKDKPGHGRAKGRLWRELSEGVFPPLNVAGETGTARQQMRMLKKLEEDFPPATVSLPLSSPPSELVCASVHACLPFLFPSSHQPATTNGGWGGAKNATAAFWLGCSWLPPSADLLLSRLNLFWTSSASRPMNPRCCSVLSSFLLSVCAFCFAGVRHWWAAKALRAQRSSKLVGRFIWSPAVRIVPLMPCVYEVLLQSRQQQSRHYREYQDQGQDKRLLKHLAALQTILNHKHFASKWTH